MTKYQVEEIDGDTVVPFGVVVADDPMKAAQAAAGGQRVSPRALQDHWFRVVDEEQAAVYEYSLAGSDELPDPEWTELSDLGPPLLGRLHGGEPANDGVDHFYTCAVCGQSVDRRDLRQVMWHEVPGHSCIEPEPVRT